MSVSEFEMFQDRQRSNWVRLRTLVTLRWIAAIGQAVAIFVAVQIYDLHLAANLAALAIGASLIANLLSSFLYPENKRLSERQAFLWLVFDIVQLSVLLYLTGGLSNPFAHPCPRRHCCHRFTSKQYDFSGPHRHHPDHPAEPVQHPY